MSSKAQILTALDVIQEQLIQLQSSVESLRARVVELREAEAPNRGYNRASAVDQGRAALGLPPSSPAPSSSPSSLPTAIQREEAARATGRFFRRALAGENRGVSERSRINLPNNFYVVVRDHNGIVHSDPVLVFETYSACAAVVVSTATGDLDSDSIFAGFNSEWEAKYAVFEAGLNWPEHRSG